jgi:hypothetical protein
MRYNHSSDIEEKRKYNGETHQLFSGFKKACGSVWRRVLYNILIQFTLHMKPVRPIVIYSKPCIENLPEKLLQKLY